MQSPNVSQYPSILIPVGTMNFKQIVLFSYLLEGGFEPQSTIESKTCMMIEYAASK